MGVKQVRDIKTPKPDSKTQYIVINYDVIKNKNVSQLYSELFMTIRGLVHSNTRVESIWFSHAPSMDYVAALGLMLGFLEYRPRLYIEKFQGFTSIYDAMGNLGCLAGLTYKYYISAWNWELFMNTHGNCSYYSDPRYDIRYMRQKAATKLILTFIGGNSTRPNLVELCGGL